ncbi:MAG TPA: hypothetical protein VEC06_08560 [Paucimonas sp.]|nr:hypothetical protein [Paucimonas sp.]
MSDLIVLLEIDGYNKDTSTVETLRFCSGLAYRLRPSETPANALYRPFLIDAGWTRVDVFNSPGDYGHVTPGRIVLDDSSGALGKSLVNYAFDGRKIVQRIGLRGAAYPGGFTTILNGTVDGPPAFGNRRIVFRPADLTASMCRPLQTLRYAGNNTLPNGLEGVDDLKGRVKPIVLALASNMEPILVNTSKLIYHVSIPLGSSTHTVSAVRDKGVPLTADPAYANVTDLLDDTKAPAAGKYKVLSTTTDGCYIRVGQSPIGQLTLDAAYGNAAARTHAQCWKRVLELFGGVSASDISSSDVTALDTALAGEIEYALFDEVKIEDVLREIAESAGASWYGDSTGVHRLQQWATPSGPAVETLTKLRNEKSELVDPIGNGDIAPAYLVTLYFGRNWTVQQDANLGGDKTNPGTDTVRAPGGRAALAARNWLAQEYRKVSATDTSVKTAHLNAVELTMRSLLNDQTQAQAFVDAQLALYKVARHMTELVVWLSQTQLNTIRVRSVVTVKDSYWNYDSGRLMRVAGIQPDMETGKTLLKCWG